MLMFRKTHRFKTVGFNIWSAQHNGLTININKLVVIPCYIFSIYKESQLICDYSKKHYVFNTFKEVKNFLNELVKSPKKMKKLGIPPNYY